MIETTEKTFSFAEFEVDTAKRLLLKNGHPVALNPKTFDLLLTLVENRGEIVHKNELLDKVWANQFVEENNLTVHISALRKALGERKNEHRFLVTVPGKGYKFVGDVKTPNDKEGEILIESRTISRVLIEEEIGEKDSEYENADGSFQGLKEGKFSKPKFAFSPTLIFLSIAVITLLAAIGFWSWNGETKPNNRESKLTKLTTSGKVINATFTPDGRYAVFAQTEDGGESLWLRQISTGSQTQVLPVKPIKFVGLAISPDANSIYATVFGGDMPDPQIWRVPLLGGAVEEMKGIKTGAAVSLSPDGRRFAFTESRSGLKETHFGVADSNGTNKQILIRAADGKRSFPNFDASPVAWSPDGSEIACVLEENFSDGTNKTGILLVNPANGTEKFISEKRWDRIEHLAWINAENLAFVAYTFNTRLGQIWKVSRNTGEVRQITNDLNNYMWLASADGNLLTVQQNSVSHLTVADFDEKAERLEPREVAKESGYIDNLAWTNDGAILYSSSASGKREIWRVNSDGSNATQLTVDANITFGLSVSPIDGSLVFCSTDDGKHSLHLADADGKNIRQLTEAAEDVSPNFTPDGQTVIFQRGLNNKTLTIWRIGINDRKPSQLTSAQASHPSVSPDGAQTAYYFMDRETDNLWRIGLISSQNGSFLGKINLPPNATDRRMRWHPSGKFIGQIFYQGENINLLLLPADDSKSQVISGLGKGDVNWFDWSRDGKQIAVSQTTKTQDIILISNF
jgi:DNA-binding winged helix-turn-helix (wHTH) protein/Tol biopolymer transport system component